MALETTGEIGRQSLIDVIREVYLADASGVLEVTQADRKRRFFFDEGELFLPGSHFLGRRLAELLELERELDLEKREAPDSDALRLAREEQESEPDKSARAREQLQELVGRIVDVLVEWHSGRYEMLSVPLPSEPELVGPLPTAYLVMEGSVRGLDPEKALEEIGGYDSVVVADTSSKLLLQPYGIDPQEMFLLSRAETPTTIGELIRQMPGSRSEAVKKLVRLLSVDLLQAASTPEGSTGRSKSYQESMVERFLLRFASQLPPSREKASEEEVAAVRSLIQRFAGLDHYEILGIEPDAKEVQIHDAFRERAVQVHPGNAERLGMRRGAAALRLLFERVTLAYLELCDSERRARYNVEAGIEIGRSATGGAKTGEQRNVALANFHRAQRMLDTGEYHFALELARQAVRADPQAPYIALLARIQRRNPNWVKQATENLKHAIRLDPKNPEYRVELGEVMEEAGHLERARVHYQATLQLSPGNGRAMEGLSRVSNEPAGSAGDRSFMGRIRDMWADSQADEDR